MKSVKVISRAICSTRVVRAAAAGAAVEGGAGEGAANLSHDKNTTSTSQFPLNKISSTLFMSRIPIVTPNLSEFEEKYYKYQDELQRRMMWTFPYYYYYKKSSLAEVSFLKNQKWPVSKQPGVYYPKGEPEIRHMRERREKQEVIIKEDADDKARDAPKKITPNSRITKADVEKDTKSLERSLDKTLYLIVKTSSGQWRFPSFGYEDKIMPLDEFADQEIKKASKTNFNMFTVSNKPVHVVRYGSSNEILGTSEGVEKREYFIKAHILAGDFSLNESSEYKDYAWVSNEELSSYLDEKYFENTKFLLAEY